MSGDADGDLSLRGWAVPDGLEELHDLFERARSAHPEVEGAAFMMLETAVIEIAGNVVEHGRPSGRVQWSFELRVLPEVLEGVLSDDGQEYEGDLSTVMPDLMSESGRGLALAWAALDSLDYAREGDHNVWTMRRDR
ncbi:ATP-binding protein [Aeromicrobium sp. HA]|uniref:ATP-binding protein n=1 Tax=Aeromicrobium sp. HA TaxID=3009077 RepID=UPI0022AE5DC3|nr:ATP-binding protein [Aeromicrobium sp. HA]